MKQAHRRVERTKQWNSIQSEITETVSPTTRKCRRASIPLLNPKVRVLMPKIKSYTKKDQQSVKYIHESFEAPIPGVYIMEGSVRSAYMKLAEYLPTMSRIMQQHDTFKVQLEDEEGNKRNDCVIALSIDGSRRGTSIGAAAEGGSENVTAFNCQHLNYPTACNSMELTHTVAVLNCKETEAPVRQCVKIFEQQLALVKSIQPDFEKTICLFKSDLKYHSEIDSNLSQSGRVGLPYIRQRTDRLQITWKVVMEVESSAQEFETVRMVDGQPFIVAKIHSPGYQEAAAVK